MDRQLSIVKIAKLAYKCAFSSNSDYAFVIGPYMEVLLRALHKGRPMNDKLAALTNMIKGVRN